MTNPASNDNTVVPSPQHQTDPSAPLLPTTNPASNSNPEQGTENTKSPAQRITHGSADMLNTVVSGATFGAALVAAGVYQPAVIIGQLELKNWHMMQAFLTATASSAAFVHLLERLGYCRQPPRQATTLKWFGAHDANIIGGSLLGVGMALSGACPGTVLAQVATGIPSGFYALDGAILAGLVWTTVLRPVLNPCHPKHSSASSTSPAPTQTPMAPTAEPSGPGEKVVKLTVQDHINCPKSTMLLSFEALCFGAVAATLYLNPPTTAAIISPVLGGFLIGLSQLWSLVTRKTLLGASSAYEEVANHIVWLFKFLPSASRPKSIKNIIFATGMVGGAFLLGKVVPGLVEGAAVPVDPVMAVAGGFLMVLGARLAGGCTSGHGISGMSLFSVSSFLTIGTALAVGVGVRAGLMPLLA